MYAGLNCALISSLSGLPAEYTYLDGVPRQCTGLPHYLSHVYAGVTGFMVEPVPTVFYRGEWIVAPARFASKFVYRSTVRLALFYIVFVCCIMHRRREII